MCCTKAPIQSLEDAIFVLPMPNIYDGGHAGVCLGNLTLSDAANPDVRSACLIETVLTSLWNMDLQPDYEPLGFKTLEEWAERSAADPSSDSTWTTSRTAPTRWAISWPPFWRNTMNPQMNKTLAAALKRCRDITPTTLDEFLGPLLDRDPDDLARLPGTPGTVLAAQFTCYAKSSASLSEVLRRQTEEAGKLTDALWRIPRAQGNTTPKQPDRGGTTVIPILCLTKNSASPALLSAPDTAGEPRSPPNGIHYLLAKSGIYKEVSNAFYIGARQGQWHRPS